MTHQIHTDKINLMKAIFVHHQYFIEHDFYALFDCKAYKNLLTTSKIRLRLSPTVENAVTKISKYNGFYFSAQHMQLVS